MTKKAELVFIPMTGMDHLVRTVQLAKLLVHLSPNLSITILTIKPPYDTRICSYVDSLTATATGRLKFISLPQPDPDVDVFKFMSRLVQTQGPLVKQAVTNIVERSNSVPDSPRLTGFVLDMFLTPFIDLANVFGVPSYAFYTSGAAFLGFQFYTMVLHDERKVEFDELEDSNTEFTIPSYVNPVSTNLFPIDMFNHESFTFLRNMVKGLRETKGIMVNTFSELESHAVDSLSNGQLQIPPVYPVGLILDLAGPRGTH
ncbi:UDP-glucose flavonoid 3-O-glucosyltransferase 6-like [Hibiscus syriacus]|uniref:UDP-glucose flavonoid 3-O-glucosyltransferase 6-like n=1 Tax=Hibiscus syriacus TaxID=106335 RepID=UPI001923B43F|nr:UDP-glucose flavonoid 3-O-glucosyltransferase 6-like [Hibiscus syriacus]